MTSKPNMPRLAAPTNVVSIFDHRAELRFPAIAQTEAYWEALRGTRLMPDRADVNPRGIENLLEYAFIGERIAPGLVRLRLAGMHMSDLVGMEVRGMPLSSFIVPHERQQMAEAIDQMFDSPACVTLTLRAETGVGRDSLDAKIILLPLKSDFGDVSRVLGAFVTNGKIGRAPRRFNILETDVRPLLKDPTGSTADGILSSRPAPQPTEDTPVIGADELQSKSSKKLKLQILTFDR